MNDPGNDSVVDEITDDDLMLRLQAGADRAFDDLVERHQSALIGFFVRNTRDRQLAEDLTQETLLRIFNQRWDYLPVGRFGGWMYRIARNLLIDHVRRRSHDALVKSVQSRPDEEASALARIADEVAPPEVKADQHELAAIVDAFLDEIPEEQRLTFLMHHYAGLPLSQVAEALETTLPTAKSRLRLAREKLQEKLRSVGISR